MKNILKYGFTALAAIAVATGCEGFEDFEENVPTPSKLTYVQAGTDNVFTVTVVHRNGTSTGAFEAEFPIKANTRAHDGFTGTLVYDASLVESYNKSHGTDYIALPEANFNIEHPTLTVPANEGSSADSVKISLAGDLRSLTARRYLAPVRLTSSGMSISSEFGVVYLAVETEVNLIRAISSVDDIDGLQPLNRSTWSADASGYASMFDGSNSTKTDFASGVVTVDMQKVLKITGLAIGYSGNSAPAVSSIEYSSDGVEFQQAGTPATNETVRASNTMSIAFTQPLDARYIRYKASNCYEFNVYMNEGTGAAVYASVNSNNVVSGVITHRAGSASSSDFSASFGVRVTSASTGSYSVNAAVDTSAVAAYNAAHGTSYAALPAANVKIDGAPLTIAAGSKSSTGQITLSLTGNLESLTNENGYLAPVKLSASGASTSTERGYVYAVLSTGANNIKPISAITDIAGTPAPRVEWTASGVNNAANMFDGSTTTYSSSINSNTAVTIDMKTSQMFSGLHLAYRSGTNYGVPSAIKIETSTDGQNFTDQGTASAAGDYVTGSNAWYVGLIEPVEARYVRFTATLSRSAQYSELNLYATDASPMVFVKAGTNNVISGNIAQTPIGIFNALNATFNIQVSSASTSGYTVVAMVDNSLVAAYNSKNGTNYSSLPTGNIDLQNAGQTIAAGATQTSQPVRVSLKGDVSTLNNTNGYLIPVKVVGGGLITSETYGTVYIAVTPKEMLFRSGFTSAEIEGAPLADRSNWEILWYDDGIYPTHDGCSYYELFDGDTASTFVRTWGGPIAFTVDLKQEYDVTGFLITARTDNNTYRTYQPNDILIEYSPDNVDYITLGQPTYSAGELVREIPTTYAWLYGSQKIRYLRITASYGSNMGTSEFNIYVK